MEYINVDFVPSSERLSSWLENSESFAGNNMNETETRNKVIDPLFKEVMGWKEEYIQREGHVEKLGYYDYIFKYNHNVFVLEAKREHVLFSMPNTNAINLNSLKEKHSGLKDAIHQGVAYAVDKNIDVVVVCNGDQLALTYIPFIPSNCYDTYLFQSRQRVGEEFTKFWNLFSPYQNIAGYLKTLLNKNKLVELRNRPSFTQKINQSQPNPEGILENNGLTAYLAQLHQQYFTEIINDGELLKKCYCDYESTKKYVKDIEFFLKDRAPRISTVVEEIEDDFLNEEIEEQVIEDIQTAKRSAGKFSNRFTDYKNKSKMFVLTGGAGVGKTTFIHRFFNFILNEKDKDATVWIYLDCKECTKDTNFDNYIYQKIEDTLLENYSEIGIFDNLEVMYEIFSQDLKKIKGLLLLIDDEKEANKKRYEKISDIIENDKVTYIKRIFEYLQKNGYSTCVVYDNVDQLDEPGLQEGLFLHANAVKERLRTIVILSLREEIYYQHERDKLFNFSECDIFHIPSPKISQVIAKRLKVAKENLEDNDMLFGVKNSKNISINVKKSDVIEILSQTFLGEADNELLLEMLSNGDVRESLRFFKKIVSSPNINIDNLLAAAGINSINARSDKRIKFDEILRGLALDNRAHYASSKSKVINIFEVDNDGFYSYFTKLRILKFAQSNSSLTKGNLPKGFFRVKDMYTEAFKNTVKNLDGFVEICNFLQKEGALLNLKGSISFLESDDFISLGPAGYYYLNHLMHNPYYLALVAIDTPLKSCHQEERIRNLYNKSLITASTVQSKRRYVEMAQEFADYLCKEEEEEISFIQSSSQLISSDDMFNVSRELKRKLDDFMAKMD